MEAGEDVGMEAFMEDDVDENPADILFNQQVAARVRERGVMNVEVEEEVKKRKWGSGVEDEEDEEEKEEGEEGEAELDAEATPLTQEEMDHNEEVDAASIATGGTKSGLSSEDLRKEYSKKKVSMIFLFVFYAYRHIFASLSGLCNIYYVSPLSLFCFSLSLSLSFFLCLISLSRALAPHHPPSFLFSPSSLFYVVFNAGTFLN